MATKSRFLGTVVSGVTPRQACASFMKALSENNSLMTFSGAKETVYSLLTNVPSTIEPFNPFSGKLNMVKGSLTSTSSIEMKPVQGTVDTIIMSCATCSSYQVSDNQHLVNHCIMCGDKLEEPAKEAVDFSIDKKEGSADLDATEVEKMRGPESFKEELREKYGIKGESDLKKRHGKSYLDQAEVDAIPVEHADSKQGSAHLETVEEVPVAKEADSGEEYFNKLNEAESVSTDQLNIDVSTNREKKIIADQLRKYPVKKQFLSKRIIVTGERSMLAGIKADLLASSSDKRTKMVLTASSSEERAIITEVLNSYSADINTVDNVGNRFEVVADSQTMSAVESELANSGQQIDVDSSFTNHIAAACGNGEADLKKHHHGKTHLETEGESEEHCETEHCETEHCETEPAKEVPSEGTSELKKRKHHSSMIVESSDKEENDFIMSTLSSFTDKISVNICGNKFSISADAATLEELKNALTSESSRKRKGRAHLETEAETPVEEEHEENEHEEQPVEGSSDLRRHTVHHAHSSEMVEVNLLESLDRKSTLASVNVDFVFRASDALNGSRWYAMVDEMPVAYATHHSAGRNAEIFHDTKFKTASAAVLSQTGVYAGLKEMGFTGINVKLPVKQLVEQKMESTKREALASASNQLEQYKKGIRDTLATAAVGLNKGFFANVSNPIKRDLYQSLSGLGIVGAEQIIDEAFSKSGDSYNKILLDKASELQNMSVAAFNEIATAVSGATYQRAAVKQTSVSSLFSQHLVGANVPAVLQQNTAVATGDDAIHTRMRAALSSIAQ